MQPPEICAVIQCGVEESRHEHKFFVFLKILQLSCPDLVSKGTALVLTVSVGLCWQESAWNGGPEIF